LNKIILPAFLLTSFATSTPLFAQALPGEANAFTPQGAGNVHTEDSYDEARDTVTGPSLLERGEDYLAIKCGFK
jgi:hypothetical protein